MGKINILDNQKRSLTISKYNSKITECKLFQEKNFILIGISLGNSYFSKERLELIINGFSNNFNKVAVLLVDDLSEHNYRAQGYDEGKIKKKVKSKSNYISNKINKAIENTNILNNKNNVDFYKWKDIESFSKYGQCLEIVEDLYKTNDEFKKIIRNTTRNVITNFIGDTIKDSMIEEAKWYYLKELAMGLCINEFVNEENIIVGYYQDFGFYRDFLQDNHMQIEGLKRQELIIYNCNLDN